MDMRMRSQNEFRDELSTMLAEVRVERERFDTRRKALDKRLDEIQKGAQEKGLQDVQRILQSLDAVQAKEQLLTMYDDERIDDVVNIIQAMSSEKRKDILAEFVLKDETDKLAEILRRIGEGTQVTSLINQARTGR
jgi:transposase